MQLSNCLSHFIVFTFIINRKESVLLLLLLYFLNLEIVTFSSSPVLVMVLQRNGRNRVDVNANTDTSDRCVQRDFQKKLTHVIIQ